MLRYGDGWMPNMKELETLTPRIDALRERAGRHVPVTYYGATPENLDTLRDAGVDRALIVLESGPAALDTLTVVTARAPFRRESGEGRRAVPTRSRSNPGGMDVTKVLGEDVLPFRTRKPRVVQGPAPGSPKYRELTKTIADEGLHTVCQEAACPNIGDCWDRGTATFMILGDTCTRRCGFCNVKTGKPTWNDPLEPLRVRTVGRPRWACATPSSRPSTATTCPTTARRCGAA